jgi:predicted NAD/FAD-binding protein
MIHLRPDRANKSMRIAIVGAGVSGLVAAHLLHPEHEVTVFEAAAYAGGHAHTVRVDTADATHHVDTGFIALNDRTYPHFTQLLERLGVATQPTHMSFAVTSADEDFEYSGTPRGLLCQPRNLLRPWFLRMLTELPRFNRELRRVLHGAGDAGRSPGGAVDLLESPRGAVDAGESPRGNVDANESLHDFLERHRFSPAFVRRLIVPQVSAVWSADPRQMDSFPVRFLAEFFANHGMLGFRDRPRWSTVSGGSARYVEALTRPFAERLHLSSPVRSIARSPTHVELAVAGHEPQRYDHVVLATHSDQALALLADPTPRERQVLGAIPYRHNEAVLHTDSSLLPRRRGVRAAWNFHLLRHPPPLTTVTYYMNHLQRLRAAQDFCVTLNRSEAIDPARVIGTFSYAHPVYTAAGVAAQSQHGAISGAEQRTHYCGAYWGWGFHEDGVVSALRACAPFGVGL